MDPTPRKSPALIASLAILALAVPLPPAAAQTPTRIVESVATFHSTSTSNVFGSSPTDCTVVASLVFSHTPADYRWQLTITHQSRSCASGFFDSSTQAPIQVNLLGDWTTGFTAHDNTWGGRDWSIGPYGSGQGITYLYTQGTWHVRTEGTFNALVAS